MSPRYRRTWIAALVVLAVAAGLVAACGGDGDDESTDAETNTTLATVGTVTLETTGGIAGIAAGIRIRPDGTVEATPPSGGDYAPTGRTLGPDALVELHELVGDGRFEALDDSYVPAGACCDLFFYTVTAELNGESVARETADTGDRPEPLNTVITILQAA